MALTFDKELPTRNGTLVGVSLLPHSGRNRGQEMCMPAEAKSTWNINQMHQVFNHAGEEALCKTAHLYNWKLVGKLERCQDCYLSNARKKGVAKTTDTHSSTPGECIYINITSSKTPSMGGNKSFYLESLMMNPILYGSSLSNARKIKSKL